MILDSGLWERDEAIEALHDSLEAHGVSVVVSLNEYQSSAEMAVDLFDPGYGIQREILATSTHPWWMLYTSHEGTTALTAGLLVDTLRQRVPDWDRWLINSPPS